MSSKLSTPVVVVVIRSNSGGLPPILELAHRHFEKAPPEEIKHLGTGLGSNVTYLAPLDLVRKVVPAHLLDGIDSVEITYRRRGTT